MAINCLYYDASIVIYDLKVLIRLATRTLVCSCIRGFFKFTHSLTGLDSAALLILINNRFTCSAKFKAQTSQTGGQLYIDASYYLVKSCSLQAVSAIPRVAKPFPGPGGRFKERHAHAGQPDPQPKVPDHIPGAGQFFIPVKS